MSCPLLSISQLAFRTWSYTFGLAWCWANRSVSVEVFTNDPGNIEDVWKLGHIFQMRSRACLVFGNKVGESAGVGGETGFRGCRRGLNNSAASVCNFYQFS
ncbi:hypothetical protein V6N13_035578 [Hibiscus sabdariffa]|uniref:Uncharacterized protein n=1 Tax=Hibiscus sabdariffa TaxID=183260 RepID=A0ABR2S952_9ROSI